MPNSLEESGLNSSQLEARRQNLINGLNALLNNMLEDPKVLTTRGIFKSTLDKERQVEQSINNIESGNFDFSSLSVSVRAELLKELLYQLRQEGIVFIDKKIDQTTQLTLSDFNQNDDIQAILKNLFQLLSNIAANSKVNQTTAEGLSLLIAPHLFKMLTHQSNGDILSIIRRQNAAIARLIDKTPTNFSRLNLKGSPSVILEKLVPGTPSPKGTYYSDYWLLPEPDKPTPSRSFGQRHLSKIIMMPLIALVAAAITVTLLIFFPPAGIPLSLALLIGAGVGAGLGGLGIGFGVGALVDSAREKEYNSLNGTKTDGLFVEASPDYQRYKPVDSNQNNNPESSAQAQPDDPTPDPSSAVFGSKW